jgi:DNA-directed RNA polymerase subunit RPC12/RpoP
MERKTPENACCRCGATAYRPVITRDATGAMKASRVYRCVGCKLEFTDIDTWRGMPLAPLSQRVFEPSQGTDG